MSKKPSLISRFFTSRPKSSSPDGQGNAPPGGYFIGRPPNSDDESALPDRSDHQDNHLSSDYFVGRPPNSNGKSARPARSDRRDNAPPGGYFIGRPPNYDDENVPPSRSDSQGNSPPGGYFIGRPPNYDDESAHPAKSNGQGNAPSGGYFIGRPPNSDDESAPPARSDGQGNPTPGGYFIGRPANSDDECTPSARSSGQGNTPPGGYFIGRPANSDDESTPPARSRGQSNAPPGGYFIGRPANTDNESAPPVAGRSDGQGNTPPGGYFIGRPAPYEEEEQPYESDTDAPIEEALSYGSPPGDEQLLALDRLAIEHDEQQNLATPEPEPSFFSKRVDITSTSNVLELIILDERAEPTNLPLALLQHITDDFADERQIGRGGFGVVYRGDLQNGSVAVKRLLNSHTIEEEPFYREATSLISVKHRNIVRFLGYCANTESKAMIHPDSGGIMKYVFAEIRERLLCFEYINNGSLDKYLTDELRGLEWHTRYQIIRGICDGLVYLHKEKGIVHRDMKPANILLDDLMIPKITDFGISKLLEGATHAVTSNSTGSLGYCAPEFIHRGVVSIKSDIYSLGFIITELVTGCKDDPDIKHVLRRWRYRWNKSAKYPPLGYEQVIKCIEIALSCLSESPKKRPYVWDLVSMLNELESTNDHINSADEYLDGPINPYPWELLEFDILELNFPFEINKQIPCSLELTNVTDDYVAFDIEMTGILQYCLEPEKGVVPPRSSCTVVVTLQARDRTPHSIMGMDEFVFRCAAVDEGLAAEDITKDMFDSRSGKAVDEVTLKVVIQSVAIA